MKFYNMVNNKQRDDLKDADIFIDENKDYSAEEISDMRKDLTSYICRKSKTKIQNEIMRFEDVIDIMDKVI